MFKRIIKNCFRLKGYSQINILGMALAMSCLILIFFWIQKELSYDCFHKNADNIYRIVDGNPADKESYAGTPVPLAGFLKEKFPEIVNYTHLDIWSFKIKANHKSFNENNIALVDSSFFTVFSFPLVKGLPNKVLINNNAVLLSESTAKKYFGDMDPINQTILIEGKTLFEITGIFEDIPNNSHIKFDIILPFNSIIENGSWDEHNYFTYILLPASFNPDVFKEKTIKWASKNSPDKAEMLKSIYYQPLKNIHFQFNRANTQPGTDKSDIYAVMAIAFIILVIACINYTNFLTVQSIGRSKEIAIRKIAGEGNNKLRLSIMAETTFISFIAFSIALVIAIFLAPYFNKISGQQISIHANSGFILSSIGIIITCGLLSGIYPAFVQSSYKPIQLFAKDIHENGKPILTDYLITFQLIISIALIICITTINKQMKYIKSKDLGFNIGQIINIPIQTLQESAKALKDEILKNPNVLAASINDYKPTINSCWSGVYLNGNPVSKDDSGNTLWIIQGDKDFFKTFQIEILEGNELINNYSSPEMGFILNESAAMLMNKGNKLGRKIPNYKPSKIIGIMKDFCFRSLHHKVEPSAYILSEYGNQISVKINGNELQSTLQYLSKCWKKLEPDFPFEYNFLDKEFENLYKSETRIKNTLFALSTFSLILSCLGIFGMAANSAIKRTKEIGIRKVNGAKTTEIMTMLNKDFIKWIIIAFLIACPIAYYTMHKWLENFAYKTELSWWVFAAAGAIAMVIALLTVSWQSYKAATKNPVEALRSE